MISTSMIRTRLSGISRVGVFQILQRKAFLLEYNTARSTVSSGRVRACATDKMKVLFCSEHFPSAFRFTRDNLLSEPDIECVYCKATEIEKAISDAAVAVPIMTALPSAVVRKGKKLKCIIQFGVGLEGVDIEQASRQGIWVSNIPSSETANGLSCAEHVVYLMLGLLRQSNEMRLSIENRKLGSPLGDVLYGKRVLILGFGGIAKHAVRLLKAFQVHLTCVRKRSWMELSSDEEEAACLIDERRNTDEMASVLPMTDFVVLACAQSEETKGIINEEFLNHCKEGVMIVNVCRGGLLDEASILRNLDIGKIGGLGLDVQWSEPFDPSHVIAKHPNVILTPHIAGVTRPSYERMSEVIGREARKIKAGERPTRIVNQHLLDEYLLNKE